MDRLKRRADFLRLKAGRRWAAPAFVLQALERADQNAPRFGFTVADHAIATVEPSGRKRGGAVKRNRARRRLKEAVRLTAPSHAKAGFDYVVVGRMEALDRRFSDLLADMKNALHKVHDASQRGRSAAKPRRPAKPGNA